MEMFKYIMNRYGMVIPFVITVALFLTSKSVEEPHASRLEAAMWVFFGVFVLWLISWIVRVGIKWVQTRKEILDGDKD